MIPRLRNRYRLAALGVLLLMRPAFAGAPYMSDDAEPTDYGHYEIYAFTGGMRTKSGASGEAGIELEYGAAPDLQIGAILPLAYDSPASGAGAADLGNVELAVKYRFLHQEDFGLDVAIFPRVFLPSGSPDVGERHASLFIPLWMEKDWGKWSLFGGGGCTIDHGGDSQNFCMLGWALARQVLPDLQIGAEIVHQTPNTKGGRQSSGIGAGFRYDLSEHYHLLGYAGPGIQNADQTDQVSWYTSLLFTF
jgi:hypothetical protein